jgi:hypothetical protein
MKYKLNNYNIYLIGGWKNAIKNKGFINYGEICFMISLFQLLFHADDIKNYILKTKFKDNLLKNIKYIIEKINDNANFQLELPIGAIKKEIGYIEENGSLKEIDIYTCDNDIKDIILNLYQNFNPETYNQKKQLYIDNLQNTDDETQIYNVIEPYYVKCQDPNIGLLETFKEKKEYLEKNIPGNLIGQEDVAELLEKILDIDEFKYTDILYIYINIYDKKYDKYIDEIIRIQNTKKTLDNIKDKTDKDKKNIEKSNDDIKNKILELNNQFKSIQDYLDNYKNEFYKKLPSSKILSDIDKTIDNYKKEFIETIINPLFNENKYKNDKYLFIKIVIGLDYKGQSFKLPYNDIRKISTEIKLINDYKLIGIVAHEGDTLTSGHYICFIYLGNNRFRIYNDTIVRDLTISEISSHSFYNKFTHTLLLYEKVEKASIPPQPKIIIPIPPKQLETTISLKQPETTISLKQPETTISLKQPENIIDIICNIVQSQS